MRHVAVMSATGAIGLMAVFAVDLLSLFWVSQLGDQAFKAAVGYAGLAMFFAMSFNIGLTIAASATVLFFVSIEICRVVPARIPRTTSITRRSSSCSEIGSAPGRADSPPTSINAAPCSANSSPCVIAASRSSKRPPSENESGVTFTIPITSGRVSDPSGCGSSSLRVRRCQCVGKEPCVMAANLARVEASSTAG